MTQDLSGKRVVVTGGNSGVGLEAARVLARRGAAVVLACRNLDKAADAVDRILDESPNASCKVLELDLSDLESVRTAAKEAGERFPQIDVLINNAGVMAVPKRQTADGFELQIGTNHLGHFALTGLLLGPLLAADQPRIVTVSSGASKAGRINFDDLNGDRRYFRWIAYSQSKLANLLFTFELQRRSERAGSPLQSVAAHPGWAATNLQTAGTRMQGGILGAIGSTVMTLGNRLLAQSAEDGAQPLVTAAVSPNVAGGDYVGPSGPFEMRGRPTKVQAVGTAHDEALARRLWEESERLTGVTYEVLEGST